MLDAFVKYFRMLKILNFIINQINSKEMNTDSPLPCILDLFHWLAYVTRQLFLVVNHF